MLASNYVKKIYSFQDDTLKIYARLWQFETWLRRMVYVELRAKKGDKWNQGLHKPNTDPKKEDKNLSHMSTPDQNDLSYAQLWHLLHLIEENWDCFIKYLPPKKIWKAKNQEIAQIRNRVAHFRTCHSDDLKRVEQFLRDLDKGFWLFCTSYNDAQPVLPAESDKVTKHFLHLDPIPWSEIQPKQWARVGHVDKSMAVGIQVNKVYRPWFVANDNKTKEIGVLYDISLLAFDRKFDAGRFLESSLHIHQHLVTLDFDSLQSTIRLIIPAVLGSKKIIELVTLAEKWAHNSVTRISPGSTPPDVASEWPEFVLSEKDPMTFLGPDMPCSFFNV